jgi:uroporphyrinogen decarboxylase
VIHFGTNTATLLELQVEAGGTVIGVDHRIPLGAAWTRIGHDKAIQGNLDPLLLCAPPDVAASRAKAVIAQAEGRPGHIFNLGHGIIPQTPVDNVKAMVDLIHSIPLQKTAT